LRQGSGPGNPGKGEIPRGTTDNELLHLTLQAGPEENLQIDSIVLTHFGTVSEPSGLITYTLHADANGNAKLDEDDRRIAGPVPILPASTCVLFLGIHEVLPAGRSAVWFVTADVAAEVKIGSTLGVNIQDVHFWSVKGADSLASVPIHGAPFLGPEMTVVDGAPLPAPSRGGICGGGPTHGPGPPAVFGLALLFLALVATMKTAAHRR
jgi:hypothetical protein